ncbi:MAG: M1 family metallopeptidase [Bacteroidales bacterium]|nr:M1 family metallopeptidase [Bacteroidales bacterium]
MKILSPNITRIALSFVLFFMGIPVFSQALSPRIANYKISVKLDPEEKILDGKMTLYWKNPSQDTIRELQFHMYLNAFKNTESTFWQESGGQLRGMKVKVSDPMVWGWVDILQMEDKNGEDLTSGIKFIQPDDDNEKDQTVISVPLVNPVKPEGSVELNIIFKSKLPRIFARTGYSDEYFLVAQWFPKIGVYEPEGMRYAEEGQWNCHQYHSHSEFYANFGVYEVEITLPERFTVGSTGVLKSKTNNDDGSKTLLYIAEDVVDFAWTASPGFQVVEDQWQDVKIMVYLQPEHLSQADRHTESVKAALSYFDKNLGKYPYSTITIVDPPLRGMGSSGMEYPTFITAGCLWGMPAGMRFTEMVTIHEFGHNYFMGLLATNEFEEAWMDEGFNTYFEARIMDYTYGDKTSFVDFNGFHFGDFENQRLGYTTMKNPKIAEVFRNAWEFQHGGYGSLSYAKSATWLLTLDRLIGRPTMDEILKTYFERWKFKHPCGKDFIDIVNEIVRKNHGTQFGDSMNWFFDQVLYGSDVCDYKLARIRNKKIKPPEGIHEISGNKMTYKSIEYENIIYESKVIIHRLGEVIMPVEVLIHFDNGEEILEKWNGKSRTKEFAYERPEKIVWAQIDPENKIMIDINFHNNSLTTKPKKAVIWKYALKFLFRLQNVMQFFSVFT